MRQMTCISLRTAGAGVLATGGGVAQAHPGHGLPSLLESHSHALEHLAASLMASVGAFELVLAGAVSFGAVLVWQRLRRGRSTSSE
jgi:hypothetical protein